ncbi:MAG: aldolase/citrate lyase family protein [bacterium]
MKRAHAGSRGEQVRSDCFIELEIKNSGGVRVQLKSKVAALYGDSNKRLIAEMCKYFGIKHAHVNIEDSGALPFVIAARFEAALKRLLPGLKAEFLLPMHEKSFSTTSKDRLRRSRLYLPGNDPKFFINAGLHRPDAIILDLEDSVAPSEKDAARLLVRNALRDVDFYGTEKMVRINQDRRGLEDLPFLVAHDVQVILIPKCESAQQVLEVENEVSRLCAEHGLENGVYFIPIIESALGVVKAYEIAGASEKNCALAIGLEDYAADLGVTRSKAGHESFYARSVIINAAKAAGLQALDSVFSDIDDIEGLKASVAEAKSLGFEGKGCIHPRQIRVVHEAFAPAPDEIAEAMQIVLAFEQAQQKGLGVIALDAKMIDAPVIKRAHKIIDLAARNNQIKADWRSDS